MTKLHNPSLSEEPRNQPMKVIPVTRRESLLSWLESTGRFRPNEISEFQDHKIPEELDYILEPEVYDPENEEDQLD